MARSLSKKTRFEVFKRDGFVCQFCGRTPPAVVLEVDHVLAVANGGTDDQDNLVTACFDCNRGKGAGHLDAASIPVAEKLAILKEREEQLKAYNRAVAASNRRRARDSARVAAIYAGAFPGWELTERFITTSLRRFLDQLPAAVVEDAMEIACANMAGSPDRAPRYFCGICWRKIREE